MAKGGGKKKKRGKKRGVYAGRKKGRGAVVPYDPNFAKSQREGGIKAYKKPGLREYASELFKHARKQGWASSAATKLGHPKAGRFLKAIGFGGQKGGAERIYVR